MSGKKAWTWGEWDFGKVSESNLTDKDGPYIEVQSGPLPTQSDYGILAPRDCVAWREWWYPAHGLGDGFEYATRELAAQTARRNGRLEVRLLATGEFPQAECVLSQNDHELTRQCLALSPKATAVVTAAKSSGKPVDVRVTAKDGRVLAAFTTPLSIAKVEPPDPAQFKERPDRQLSVEELYSRTEVRSEHRSSESAGILRKGPAAQPRLRGGAAVAGRVGLRGGALPAGSRKAPKGAIGRDSDNGLCWFYLGACRLRQHNPQEALRCGYRAARCSATASIGYDLAGRAAMNLEDAAGAVAAFEKAMRANGNDPLAADHLMLALHAAGDTAAARPGLPSGGWRRTPRRCCPRRCWLCKIRRRWRRLPARCDPSSVSATSRFWKRASPLPSWAGLKRPGKFSRRSASMPHRRPNGASCRSTTSPGMRRCGEIRLPRGSGSSKRKGASQPCVFASRPEEVEILQYATAQNHNDSQAHLQLGCLLANLGRVDEAEAEWQKAAALNSGLSIAWRNLGLAAAKTDLAKAEDFYRKAIAARPEDQTLYRDLANMLIAGGSRVKAIRLLETMPCKGMSPGRLHPGHGGILRGRTAL